MAMGLFIPLLRKVLMSTAAQSTTNMIQSNGKVFNPTLTLTSVSQQALNIHKWQQPPASVNCTACSLTFTRNRFCLNSSVNWPFRCHYLQVWCRHFLQWNICQCVGLLRTPPHGTCTEHWGIQSTLMGCHSRFQLEWQVLHDILISLCTQVRPNFFQFYWCYYFIW